MAEIASAQQWGLLNWLECPPALAIMVSLVLLDLAIYAQHVAMHKVAFFWRFHSVHHTDEVFGVTTAVRFHPIEIVASMLYKSLLVVLLGAPAFAVFLIEVILSSAALFNHSNITIHPKVERVLRWFIVTPDMHRIHHSVINKETDSNYGFNLPYWDRIFKTYTAEPKYGAQQMQIGLLQYKAEGISDIVRLLKYPFQNNKN